MNIFEALRRGKGCINEENVSSFLGYLLDPSEDHGLKNIFFNKFLKLIGLDESEIETTDLNEVEIKLEYPVSKRKIDIVFETSKHVIAIENKILEQSKQENQIQEEYNGLKDSDLVTKSIIMCYLVPEDDGKLIDTSEGDKLVTILWADVIKSLTEILQQENSAEINPINDYVKHTLKAFINFMNSSIKPITFPLEYDKSTYRIYRYSSGKIILEKESEAGWQCVSARDILRRKLAELDNENYTYEDTSDGNKYTTRVLGSMVFKRLSK